MRKDGQKLPQSRYTDGQKSQRKNIQHHLPSWECKTTLTYHLTPVKLASQRTETSVGMNSRLVGTLTGLVFLKMIWTLPKK